MLRKLTTITIACLVGIGTMASHASAQSSKVQVKGETVNVRQAPNTSSRVVTTVSRGATATVVSREGAWAKLKFSDGKVGYVRRDLLQAHTGSSTTQASNSGSSRVAIKGSTVNVRSKPNTTSSVVRTAAQGTVATLMAREGEWAKLKFSDGKVGYVRRDLLTSNVSTTAASPAPAKVAIKAAAANVRRGAGTSSAVMTTVTQGTVATIVSTQGEWAKLQFSGGTVGWVRRDLLTSNISSTASGPQMVVTRVPNVIVRSGPSTSTRQVAKVARDTVATVLSRDGEWTKLRFQGGTVGYVRRDLLASAPPNGKPTHAVSGEKINHISTSLVKINANNVSVRREASTTSQRVTQVDRGTVATILDRQGAWYRVKFEHGTVGFVRGDLLNPFTRTGSGSRTASSAYVAAKSAPKIAVNPNDVLVVAEAKRMLGTPYVFASHTTRGVDCSGLAYYLYRTFEGVTLPRTSRDMASYGVAVSRENVSPGDLLFFHTRGSSRINHVGIYIGGGKFIHSSSSAGRVVIGSCDGGYYKTRLAAIRRVKSTLKKAGGGSSTAPKPAESNPEQKPEPKPESKPAETKADPDPPSDFGSGDGE